jgi:hypothetical protein
MIISKDSDYNHSDHSKECKICGGKGVIEVFRDDLEEFEEVDCLCVS